MLASTNVRSDRNWFSSKWPGAQMTTVMPFPKSSSIYCHHYYRHIYQSSSLHIIIIDRRGCGCSQRCSGWSGESEAAIKQTNKKEKKLIFLSDQAEFIFWTWSSYNTQELIYRMRVVTEKDAKMKEVWNKKDVKMKEVLIWEYFRSIHIL